MPTEDAIYCARCNVLLSVLERTRYFSAGQGGHVIKNGRTKLYCDRCCSILRKIEQRKKVANAESQEAERAD